MQIEGQTTNNLFQIVLIKIIFFLHSRLSIIDLDERSNQPFEKDNLVIIFNGEIYNYIEIRKKLIKLGIFLNKL